MLFQANTHIAAPLLFFVYSTQVHKVVLVASCFTEHGWRLGRAELQTPPFFSAAPSALAKLLPDIRHPYLLACPPSSLLRSQTVEMCTDDTVLLLPTPVAMLGGEGIQGKPIGQCIHQINISLSTGNLSGLSVFFLLDDISVIHDLGASCKPILKAVPDVLAVIT